MTDDDCKVVPIRKTDPNAFSLDEVVGFMRPQLAKWAQKDEPDLKHPDHKRYLHPSTGVMTRRYPDKGEVTFEFYARDPVRGYNFIVGLRIRLAELNTTTEQAKQYLAKKLLEVHMAIVNTRAMQDGSQIPIRHVSTNSSELSMLD